MKYWKEILGTVVGALLIGWVVQADDAYWHVHDTHNAQLYLAMDTWVEVEKTRRLDSYREQISEWKWRKLNATKPEDINFIQLKIEEIEAEREDFLRGAR